ncbi:MAG: UPF0182 family protein [Polyangiales bacterium]
MREVRQTRNLALTIAGVFVFAVCVPWLAELYLDAKWFGVLRQYDIWRGQLTAKLGLAAAGGLVAFGVLFGNVRLALRRAANLGGFTIGDGTVGPRVNLGPLAARVGLPVSIGLALLFAIASASGWYDWLLFSHAVDFGKADPLLHLDAGVFVFRLPFIEGLVLYLRWLVTLSVMLTAFSYVVLGAIRPGVGLPSIGREAKAHLAALGACLFLVLAGDAAVDILGLLRSNMGRVEGASYVDVHARLPALRALVVVSVAGAVLVFVAARADRRQPLLLAAALYAGVLFVGVRGIPALVHQYTVVPNEISLEAPYIQHNIEATRFAFALDGVSTRELSANAQLSKEDVERDRAVIENVRVWDHEQLLNTFAEIQEIRPYYDFQAVDNDRYVLDGKLRQVMLSPRELNTARLPNRSWVTEHLVYTHGFGITLGPVNLATEQGLPELYVRDIPPVSTVADLEVKRSGIYVGEVPNEGDYVFVKTAHKEFDYPAEKDVYGEYQGKGGIPLDLLTKLALAVNTTSFNVLLADDLREGSRVMLHRNVLARVERLFPFLLVDDDPYMVVRQNGELVWILDAYTATNRYPYGESYEGGVNYMRNSVKFVVDAYDGTVDAYVADPKDPILRAWRGIFPHAFQSMDAMPSDVRSHLRYPERIFRIQSEMLATYHMDTAEQLYNREDAWDVPTITSPIAQDADAGTRASTMRPFYTIMRLPSEAKPEFIQMLPFTPKGKRNLAAWFVSRMDDEHLGELVVYHFPKDRLVFGPDQVMNRINQDAEISRQITLWNDANSKTVLGTLLVLPIEESIIYVCPLYLQSSGGRLPELKRVIVSYENRMVMEASLDEALDRLFAPDGAEAGATAQKTDEVDGAGVAVKPAEAAPESAGTAPAAPRSAAVRAREAFERAEGAARKGDWAGYGRSLDELRRALDELAPGNGRAAPTAKPAMQ